MKLPENLIVAGDGALCRMVKIPGGWSCYDIRQNYSYHHREIKTVADMKACLRAGEFAWPGGYACFFITDDGAALSFRAAREEFRSIAYAIRDKTSDGWRVIGLECMANCDEPVYCDHTGKEIS